MKKTILLSVLSLVACNTKTETKEAYTLGSFELGGPLGKDTINIIDGNNRKQGLWIMRISKDTVVYRNDTMHSVTNMTSGEMIRLLKSGQMHHFITYDSLAVKSE